MAKTKEFTKRVGVYGLGAENVALYMEGSSGGRFHLMPGDGSVPFIVVGHYHGQHWDKVVGVLLHEVLELIMARHGWRHMPAPSISDSSGDYIFLTTHEQFAVVAQAAGDFLAACLPALAKAHKEAKAWLTQPPVMNKKKPTKRKPRK